MKIIGKPYSGKPNVRFDEGELEIEPSSYYASSLLYCYTYQKVPVNWLCQRVLFKKSHNGHFFNSLPSVFLKSIPDQQK